VCVVCAVSMSPFQRMRVVPIAFSFPMGFPIDRDRIRRITIPPFVYREGSSGLFFSRKRGTGKGWGQGSFEGIPSRDKPEESRQLSPHRIPFKEGILKGVDSLSPVSRLFFCLQKLDFLPPGVVKRCPGFGSDHRGPVVPQCCPATADPPSRPAIPPPHEPVAGPPHVPGRPLRLRRWLRRRPAAPRPPPCPRHPRPPRWCGDPSDVTPRGNKDPETCTFFDRDPGSSHTVFGESVSVGPSTMITKAHQ